MLSPTTTFVISALLATLFGPTATAQTSIQEGSSTMHPTPIIHTVPVPGASIHVEQRGTGPVLLLLPGGAQDAGVFTGLASVLADRFTTLALDPRCNSRSRCADMTIDLDLDQHADDAAQVISALADGPVLVFGTSGGAQVGLNLAARYPDLVRRLVAHEPPSMMLMNDPSAPLAGAKALQDTYLRHGARAAMARFMAENGLDGSDAPADGLPDDLAQTFGRMSGNFEYWLAHGMMPLSLYRADVAALRSGRTAIVVALGTGSVGQPIHAMGSALADALDIEAIPFPGDHMGFLSEPLEFALALQAALTAE